MALWNYLGNKAKEAFTHPYDQGKRIYNTLGEIGDGDWRGAVGEVTGAVKIPFSNQHSLGDVWNAARDKGWLDGDGPSSGELPDWLGGGDGEDAYAKKAEGYDAIRAETNRLQEGRRGDMDRAYALQMKAHEPSRKALAALYGDPSTWKL